MELVIVMDRHPIPQKKKILRGHIIAMMLCYVVSAMEFLHAVTFPVL